MPSGVGRSVGAGACFDAELMDFNRPTNGLRGARTARRIRESRRVQAGCECRKSARQNARIVCIYGPPPASVSPARTTSPLHRSAVVVERLEMRPGGAADDLAVAGRKIHRMPPPAVARRRPCTDRYRDRSSSRRMPPVVERSEPAECGTHGVGVDEDVTFPGQGRLQRLVGISAVSGTCRSISPRAFSATRAPTPEALRTAGDWWHSRIC